MSVLADAGIKLDEAHAAIVALSDVFSPRQLKPGQPIKLTLAPSGQDDAEFDGSGSSELQLMALSLQPSVARNVELVRGLDGAFTAQSTDVPLHREMARAAGNIQSSLFEAGQADGVPIEVMSEIIHAFSYDVDFQRAKFSRVIAMRCSTSAMPTARATWPRSAIFSMPRSH